MPKPFGGAPGAASGSRHPMSPPVPSGVAPTGGGGGGLGSLLQGIFPEKGSKANHDMVMQLVQAGMASAQRSKSPLANLLAPIAGAVVGGRSAQNHDEYQKKTNDEMTAAILGASGQDPNVQSYMGVLNDPQAPAHLKSIAKARLDAAIKPKSSTVRRSGGSRPSSGKPKGSRLYGEYDIGGIMHGRDSYGKMVPYTDPDGKPVPIRGATSTTTKAAPAATGVDESDPLGILGAPPA